MTNYDGTEIDTYFRDSHEWVPVAVTVNGEKRKTGVQLACVRAGSVPAESDWITAEENFGDIGVWSGPRPIGIWVVFYRIDANPERPVALAAGAFRTN